MLSRTASVIIRDSSQIDPGTIVNSDISATAAIAFSKLDAANINANLVADGDNTRSLGSAARRWANLIAYTQEVSYSRVNFYPWVTLVQSLGDSLNVWATIWAGDIQGGARGLVMLSGMMGG